MADGADKTNNEPFFTCLFIRARASRNLHFCVNFKALNTLTSVWLVIYSFCSVFIKLYTGSKHIDCHTSSIRDSKILNNNLENKRI